MQYLFQKYKKKIKKEKKVELNKCSEANLQKQLNNNNNNNNLKEYT